MDDRDLQDALRGLADEEVDAIERFVHRLLQEGWIGHDAADRWQSALERAHRQLPLRRVQGYSPRI